MNLEIHPSPETVPENIACDTELDTTTRTEPERPRNANPTPSEAAPLEAVTPKVTKKHEQWLADFALELALLDAPKQQINYWTDQYRNFPEIVHSDPVEVAHKISLENNAWIESQHPATFAMCLHSTSHLYFLFPIVALIQEISTRGFSLTLNLSWHNLIGLMFVLIFPWGTAILRWVYENHHWHRLLLAVPLSILLLVGIIFLPEYCLGRTSLKQSHGTMNSLIALAFYLAAMIVLYQLIKRWAENDEEKLLIGHRSTKDENVDQQNQAWINTFYQQLCNQHLYTRRRALSQINEVQSHLHDLAQNHPEDTTITALNEFGSPVVYAQQIAENNLLAQRKKLLFNLFCYVFIGVIFATAVVFLLLDLIFNQFSVYNLISIVLGSIFELIIGVSIISNYQNWRKLQK